MDAAIPVFAAPDHGRGGFRIGAIAPNEHDIVAALLALHPASWESAQTVARQIGVAPEAINPDDPRLTILRAFG